jgi:hypothetical protein
MLMGEEEKKTPWQRDFVEEAQAVGASLAGNKATPV